MKVQRIKASETHPWLLHKHYAHRIPSISYAFGLFNENELIGICTYGKPVSNGLCEGICGKKWKNMVYELNRLCINDGLPENTLSFFLAKTLTFLRTGLILVSYADEWQGHHGYIYQATNWIYTGRTKERTDINSNGHSRHYDKTQDYSKDRKTRTAKHRYVYFAGKKKFTKQMQKDLNYPILPYPKGDNKKYDASFEPDIQLTFKDF